MSFIKEFVEFLMMRKKIWLFPIIFILIFVFATQLSATPPAIHKLEIFP